MRRRRRPRTARCRRCKGAIVVKGKGPVPLFCSHSCRQMAYQERRLKVPKTLEQISTLAARGVIRAEIWEVLRQAGLAESPPPPPRKKRSHLRLIKKGSP